MDKSTNPTGWVEYLDKGKNKPYYYNTATKETVWAIPAEYEEWKEQQALNNNASSSSIATSATGIISTANASITKKAHFDVFMKNASAEDNNVIDTFLKTTSWRKAKNADGRIYYFQKETKVTQWHEPDIVLEYLTEFVKSKEIAAQPAVKPATTIIKKRKVAELEEIVEEDYATVPKPVSGDQSDLLENEGDDDFGMEDDHESDEGEIEGDRGDDDEDEYDEDDEDQVRGEGEEFDDYYDDVLHSDSGRPDMAPKDDPEADALRAMEREAETEQEEVARLESLLAQRDAIMEPRTIGAAKRMFQLTQDGPRIIQRMSEGYLGFPQMTRIVGEWLMLAKSLSEDGSGVAASSSGASDASQSSASALTESIAADFVANTIKQRFDKTLADQLLRLSVLPDWLGGLMVDPTYRRMLIELYDLHSDSNVLGYCLREISQMGHHREIAQVIRESEYFLVFNDLLVDMLSRISSASATEIAKLTENLKRSCCSSEYMFLYANRLFAQVEQILLDEEQALAEMAMETEVLTSGGGKSSAVVRCEIYLGLRCKVRRLRQELEGAAIWRNVGDSAGRMDQASQFAMRLAGTFVSNQTAATNNNTSPSAAVVYEIGDMLKTNEVTIVHIQRLCMHYFRLPFTANGSEYTITKETLRDLPAPLFYLRHPQVLKLCIDALIHPLRLLQEGTSRVAKLLALACAFDDGFSELRSLASQTRDVPKLSFSESEYDAKAEEIKSLEADLIAACGICADIIRMAFGVLTFEKPAQLISLIDSPAVSMSVIRWMDYHVRDGPLKSNAAFLTILPIFFQIIVTCVEKHPLQRPDCFDVLCSILALSSLSSADDEASKHLATGTYTIISVHENALECMVFLIGCGFTMVPISYIIKQAPGFDAVLLKHTIKLLLASIQPPFSKHFALKLFGFIAENLPKIQRWTKDEIAAVILFRDSLLMEETMGDIEKALNVSVLDVFESAINKRM